MNNKEREVGKMVEIKIWESNGKDCSCDVLSYGTEWYKPRINKSRLSEKQLSKLKENGCITIIANERYLY
jgi:hypothetical protein